MNETMMRQFRHARLQGVKKWFWFIVYSPYEGVAFIFNSLNINLLRLITVVRVTAKGGGNGRCNEILLYREENANVLVKQ